MKNVYLDSSATSMMKPPEVYKAMDEYFRNHNCNPGRGGYRESIYSSKEIFKVRGLLLELFHAKKEDSVIFTKNITEALNIVVRGMVRKGDHLIISSIEHNSVYRLVHHLHLEGIIEYSILPVSKSGEVDLELLDKMIKKNTTAICLNHASNVTGAVMPIYEIGRIADKKNLFFIIDTAQSAGIIDIDLTKFHKKTVITFTGHKHLLGSMGTGGFIINTEISQDINPLTFGGTGSYSEDLEEIITLPDRYENGTLNAPGIVALGSGVEYILELGINNICSKEKKIFTRLEEGLKGIKEINIFGDEIKVKTSVITFVVKGSDPSKLAFLLDDKYGIMARAGMHCSPLAHETFGDGKGGLRFSVGYGNTIEEMDYVVDVLKGIFK